jgi:AcrR family transcriptional regulator
MPRPDVSEERINQILDAAIAVFARAGFDQTSMEDVADQVDIAPQRSDPGANAAMEWCWYADNR